MNLFESGDFTLHSGVKSIWKVDCDALSGGSWATLAAVAAGRLPAFGRVVGVPRGGLKFAEALRENVGATGPLLIADDVLTSGGSLAELRDYLVRSADADVDGPLLGVVAFACGHPPPWVVPLWVDGSLYLEMRERAEAAERRAEALVEQLRALAPSTWDGKPG